MPTLTTDPKTAPSPSPIPSEQLFGIMAEFDNQEDLLTACRNARDAGYKKMDAYTPVPIHDLTDALGWENDTLQKVVLCGGLLGCLSGFSLMYYITMITYPMNIGGKPHFSWPAYVPPTFEMSILFAAFAAVFGMIALNGLPMPYHPVWNNPRFAMASQDRYFLCIEAVDAKFDRDATRRFLEAQPTREVVEVAK
ncbi:MAG: DUF3341 domain-containing protein [Bryobacteraceae bacterium]